MQGSNSVWVWNSSNGSWYNFAHQQDMLPQVYIGATTLPSSGQMIVVAGNTTQGGSSGMLQKFDINSWSWSFPSSSKFVLVICWKMFINKIFTPFFFSSPNYYYNCNIQSKKRYIPPYIFIYIYIYSSLSTLPFFCLYCVVVISIVLYTYYILYNLKKGTSS